MILGRRQVQGRTDAEGRLALVGERAIVAKTEKLGDLRRRIDGRPGRRRLGSRRCHRGRRGVRCALVGPLHLALRLGKQSLDLILVNNHRARLPDGKRLTLPAFPAI